MKSTHLHQTTGNGPSIWITSAHDLKHVAELRRLIENLIQTRTRSRIQFKDDKLDLLRDIVKKNIDRKILLFTQFKDTAVYLYENLQDLISEDFSIRIVTGDTKDKILEVMRFSPSSQQDIIARSCKLDGQRTDFLITTDALSEGVNMQEADIVINYDLPWNPVRIIQRVGRVDRIGSNKRFKVINFIPSRSIDKGLGLLKTLSDKIDNIIEILGIEHSILSLEEREKIRGQEQKMLKAIEEKVEAQRKLQLEKLEVQYEGRKIGELDKYLMSQMLDHQVRMSDIVDVRVPDRPFYTVLKDKQHRLLFLYGISDGLTNRYESVLWETSMWRRERVPIVEELVSPREELVDRDLDCIKAFDTEYLRGEVNSAKAAQHEALDPDTNKAKLDIVTELQSYVQRISLTGDDEGLRERIAPLLSRLEAVSVPRTAKTDLIRLRRDWINGRRYSREGDVFLKDLKRVVVELEQSSTQTIRASDIRGELRAFIVYDRE